MAKKNRDKAVIGAAAWDQFQERLVEFLGHMEHSDDLLLLETPDGGSADLTAPYAQFTVSDPGWMLVELSGNAVLLAEHQLGATQVANLLADEWVEPFVGLGFRNFRTEGPVDEDAERMAGLVRRGLSEQFGIPDPGLLSFRVSGPCAEHVGRLGLVASDELAGASRVDDSRSMTVPAPRDADHLRELVVESLQQADAGEVLVDEDSDIVIEHEGNPVFLRVRADIPTVEIFTRVVHDVSSRQQAALEISVLNRQHPLSKLVLEDRSVLLISHVPALPYVDEHLRGMLSFFLLSLERVRSDLALLTGAEEN